MRAIEVPQTLDVWEKCQSDEVQGCEANEIPLHVWQDEEAEGVRLWGRAEKDFLSFGSTRDDLVYPIFMKTLESMRWRLAEHAKEDRWAKPTIGCAILGTRLCTVLRCVRITRVFRVQYGPAAWSTVLKNGLFRTLVWIVIMERLGMTLRMCTSVAG
jgi:hypothetical protein